MGRTDLRFGVWTDSGQWAPGLDLPNGRLARSYAPEDLLVFPALLHAGACFYAYGDESGIPLSDEIRAQLAEFAQRLEGAFDLAV